MTAKEFAARAVRSEERRLGIPRGWWGTWRDVTNGTVRVRLTGECWGIWCAGLLISKHGSKASALRKARKL